jgi:hypothetical protein
VAEIVEVESSDVATIESAREHIDRRVEWAIRMIADQCWTPKTPPLDWAGRDEIITMAREKYRFDRAAAAEFIDHVAAELAIDQFADAEMLRRLAIMRAIGIRQLILRAMRDGRRETHFEFEKRTGPDGGDPTFVRVPVKEKVYTGSDMAQVAQLREIDKTLADLLGVSDGKEIIHQNTLAIIMRERKDDTRSMAATARSVDLGRLIESDPIVRQNVEAAIVEAANPKPRKAKKKKD